MQVAIIVLIVLCCVLLVLFVLAQNSKGGASAQFGGSGGGQAMGVKKTTDLLEKLTWAFAIALIVLSVGLNVVFIDSNNAEVAASTDPNFQVAQDKAENGEGIAEEVMTDSSAQ